MERHGPARAGQAGEDRVGSEWNVKAGEARMGRELNGVAVKG